MRQVAKIDFSSLSPELQELLVFLSHYPNWKTLIHSDGTPEQSLANANYRRVNVRRRV